MLDIEVTCNTEDDVLFRNIAENARKVSRWLSKTPQHEGHAVIVGGGPSLADKLHIVIKRRELGQTIFALNGACGFLNRHGIVPDYQVILDARPGNKALIGEAEHYLFASQCDPSLFEGVAPVTLWHPALEGISEHLPDHEEPYVEIGGGTTVGLSSMVLAYAMGFRKLHCVAYDCSHREGQGHAYVQAQNAGETLCKVTLGGRVFTSSLAMARQAERFPQVSSDLIAQGCIVTMDADGLIMAVLDEIRKEL